MKSVEPEERIPTKNNIPNAADNVKRKFRGKSRSRISDLVQCQDVGAKRPSALQCAQGRAIFAKRILQAKAVECRMKNWFALSLFAAVKFGAKRRICAGQLYQCLALSAKRTMLTRAEYVPMRNVWAPSCLPRAFQWKGSPNGAKRRGLMRPVGSCGA